METTTVTKQDVEAAFDRHTAIDVEMEEAAIKVEPRESNRFWLTRVQGEFAEGEKRTSKQGVKMGDFWDAPYEGPSWGHDHKRGFVLWRDGTKYMDKRGLTPQQMMEDSELEKVLFQGEGFRISLLRTEIRQPTDTHYGYKMLPAKYALIDDATGDILVLEKNKSKFTQKAVGTYDEPKTVVDELQVNHNRFRITVVKSTDTKRVRELDVAYEFCMDNASDRHLDQAGDNVWVVYFHGLKWSGMGYSVMKRNATWCFYRGEKKPTYLEVLEYIVREYYYYSSKGVIDVLEDAKKNGVDLNTVDMRWEESKCSSLPKFMKTLKTVLNIDSVQLHNMLFPDVEPKNYRFRITRTDNIPLTEPHHFRDKKNIINENLVVRI